MKNLSIRPVNFNRIEFWGVTTLFVFAVFFFITNGLENDVANIETSNRGLFNDVGIPFHYYKHYFVPTLIRLTYLFLSFLFLNFYVVPKLVAREETTWNITFVILLFIISGLAFGSLDTYLKGYLFARYVNAHETYTVIYQKSFLYAAWLLLVFGFYTVIKYTGQYLLYNAEGIQSKYVVLTREGLITLVIWMISMFLLVVSNAESQIIVGWSLVVPFGVLLYGYALKVLLPKCIAKKKPFWTYIGRSTLILAIAYLPVTFVLLPFLRHPDAAFAFSFFNTAFQFFITVPLAWVVFKRSIRGSEEVHLLKKELGLSTASFDFLRSQINPHFLFNALNTIYGTALQEGAERTAEGVEKLGDMMRFMLQENMQEKISLAREIEYLNNYISLQKLRTDPTPSISIEAHIEQPAQPVQIAPMLLIPFVENAFKHGISFREPSHIKTTLEVRGQTLYFDVYNSRHQRPEHDPEADKSGIGLANVRQRLQLLYPQKHELQIRETGKEFFVHLTVQLT